MGDQWTLSNSESPLFNIASSFKTSAFAYSVAPSFPNYSMQHISLKPSNVIGDVAGQTAHYKIPRYGLVCNTYFRVKITKPAAAKLSHAVGAHIFKSIDLATHNNHIQQFWGEALVSWVNSLDSRKENYKKGMLFNPVNEGVGQTEVSLLIPIPFYFTQSTVMYADTRFIESLEIIAEFNKASYWCDDSSATVSADVVLKFLTLQEEEYSKLQLENYSTDSGKPLTQMVYNQFREQPAKEPLPIAILDSGVYRGSLSIDLRSNNVVFRSDVCVRRRDTYNKNDLAVLTSIRVTSAGQTIAEYIGDELLLMNNTSFISRESTTVGSGSAIDADDRTYVVPYSVNPQSMTQMLGALSLKNLAAPTLSVDYEYTNTSGVDIAAAQFELSCVHWHYSLLDTSPSDGKLSSHLNL
jgi:hypothetical protein